MKSSSACGGVVSWLAVPDPLAVVTPTRHQVSGSTPFAGGEGCWYTPGAVVFTTKLDGRLWRYDEASSMLTVLYDATAQGAPVLTGVDNLTAWPGGGLVVCEDGGDMQLVVLAPDGNAAPFLQVLGQDESELTGVAFDPSGTRLYFSSQRGPTPKRLPDIVPGAINEYPLGITFEVTGPFVSAAGAGG